MEKIFLIVLFSSLPAISIQPERRGISLTSLQRQMMETDVSDLRLMSSCINTKDYAEKAVWQPLPNRGKADFLLVDKRRRLLHVFSEGELFASFRVALGGSPLGDKRQEGDQKTPEGLYFIDLKNTSSEFHLSLRINYPNSQDLEEAQRSGVRNPGGNIMIHGLPNSWFKRRIVGHPRDWTRGCIAVRNDEIERIFSWVELGTLIEICP